MTLILRWMMTITMNGKGRTENGNTFSREQEITQILAPWLRAKVENGLLKIWLADSAPEYVKEIYRSCYS